MGSPVFSRRVGAWAEMVGGGCTSCPLTEVVGVVSDVKYQGLDGNGDGVYQTASADSSSMRLVARTTSLEI